MNFTYITLIWYGEQTNPVTRVNPTNFSKE